MRRGFRLEVRHAPGRRARLAALAACLSIGGTALSAAPALAVNPTPGFFGDENNGCNVGNCSLREAINASAPNDTIRLEAGIYQLSIGPGAGNYDDTNASGDLDINKPVTIIGAGMDATVVQGTDSGAVDGVFHVRNALNISQLTVRFGNRPLSPPEAEKRGWGAGGGFRVGNQGADAGTLVASAVKVFVNQAHFGGGVFVSAAREGTPRSSARFTDSVIYANQATTGGGFNSYGDIVLERTAVFGNDAAGQGGGFFLWASPRANLTAKNSTIADNSAGTNGGGMLTGGIVTLDFVTFAGNQAGNGASVFHDGGQVTLRRSIISGPLATNCTGMRAAGDIASAGFNYEDGHVCLPSSDPDGDGVFEATDSTDRIDQEPNLKLEPPAPADNVFWYGLGTGSVAIDAIRDRCFAGAVGNDQRNVARPVGEGCDIGAIEFVPPPPPPPPPVVDVGIESFVESVRPAIVGQDLRYDMVARSIGTDAAHDVVFTTSIPATTTFVSASPNCIRPRADSVRCELGNLAPGQTTSVQLTVRPTTPGVVQNRGDLSVSAATPDVNAGNDQQRTAVDVLPAGSSGDAAEVSVALRKAVKKSAKKIGFRVTTNQAGSKATVSLRDSRGRTLARKTVTLAEAGTRTVSIKMTKALKRKLRRLKRGSKLIAHVLLDPPTGDNVEDTATLRLSKKRSIVKP